WRLACHRKWPAYDSGTSLKQATHGSVDGKGADDALFYFSWLGTITGFNYPQSEMVCIMALCNRREREYEPAHGPVLT
ncbi:MAG: hypothetical protein KC615_19775, partial [Anaerolineae bacterium]|nr:hypothetical protein [Anaerolineae bacterium]